METRKPFGGIENKVKALLKKTKIWEGRLTMETSSSRNMGLFLLIFLPFLGFFVGTQYQFILYQDVNGSAKTDRSSEK